MSKGWGMNISNFPQVHEHILEIMELIKHEASGYLAYPYLTVTYGQHYGGAIFCWDNHHMTLRFAASGEPEQMRYFVDNLLNFQTTSGYVPCIITAADGSNGTPNNFHAQPFLAQNAAIYSSLTGDTAWVKTVLPKLKKYISYWLEKHAAPFGLFRWYYPYMSGFDNEIISTILPPDTVIPPDINAWLYLELKSMAYLANFVQDEAEVDFVDKAEKLKNAINEHLWNEEYGTYAAYDLCAGKTRISWNDNTLSGDVGTFAYLSCPSLIPLFARVAGPKQAERMIRSYVLDPQHFRSPYGIRSLSQSSEYYNNARWGNPPRYGDPRRLTNSNWQGPVWIPLNWFVFHALIHYGFPAEAEELANDTFKVISMSIEKFGYMRENFHGDTGEPLYADKFASWNILADLMPDYLPGGDKKLPIFAFEE